MRPYCLFVISAAFFTITCFCSFAQVSLQREHDYVMRVDAHLSSQQQAHLQSQLGFSQSSKHAHNTKRQVSLSAGQYQTLKTIPEMQQAISAGYLRVEPNVPFQISAIPDDVAYQEQWGLNNEGTISADISAESAWNLTTVSNGIAGIIDTGIDYGHEDLGDNIWQNLGEDADGDGKVLQWNSSTNRWEMDPDDLDNIDTDGNGYIDDLIGWDFVNDDNDPFDDNGHGTHVAGILGAKGNNGTGISGVSWSANMMALKAFDHRGAGLLGDILEALAYARMMGVQLTNNSWGGLAYSQFLYDEIQLAADSGQLFIAAAGNGGSRFTFFPVYPAAYDCANILSVVASDDKDRLASFSNYSNLFADIAAPGERIYSTLPNNSYGYKSGTSMSTPFVSGAALLLWSYAPNLEYSAVIDHLLESVDILPAFYGSCSSSGRLNLFQALLSVNVSPLDLQANFQAPSQSCSNQTIDFVNNSTGGLGGESYDWRIDGISVSQNEQLSYSFSSSGWYEVELLVTEGINRDSFTQAIQITPPAVASLGNDTSLCASAIVLDAGTDDYTFHWKRLQCNGGPCNGQPIDFGTTDSIRFGQANGSISGFEFESILADQDSNIVAVAKDYLFPPQDTAGLYQIFLALYESSHPPSGITSGNHLTQIDFGSAACVGITDPLFVEIANSEDLGSGPILTVRESGSYILTATDACGNVATDTIHLTLTDGCVWPGDVNADGFVSLLDFLSLGSAQSQSGPARPSASSDWGSQSSSDWSSQFVANHALAPSVNHKHADCDGDGIIDVATDGQVVGANLGFLHEANIGSGSDGAALQIQHQATIFNHPDTAILSFELELEGAMGADIQDVLGIAFNLEFSESIAEEPDFQRSAGSWMGSTAELVALLDGSQQGSGAQHLLANRRTSGFAMVATSNTGSTGSGKFAGIDITVTVEDIADDPTALGFTSLTISTNNLILLNDQGELIPVSPSESQQTITVEITWPDSSSSFPVEWLDIQVEQQANDAQIQWRTASEQANSHFDIERSLDGVLFAAIGQVEAAGQSQQVQTYDFLDEDIALSHRRLYYRLRQVDVDGQYSYSKVVVLRIDSPHLLWLATSPNPFHAELSLDFQVHSSGGAQLRIVNTLGQQLYQTILGEQEGRIEVPTPHWPAGIYYIILESESQKRMLKLVKRN